MNDLISINDKDKFDHAVRVAQTLSRSSMVPMNFRGKPEDVFACLVLGSELGFSPMQALQSIVIIQGNVTLKAQSMLAVARAKLPDLKLTIKESENSVTVTCQRKSGDAPYIAIWDDEKAKAFGLLGKDNYKKQKLNMFKWRAISEALRVIAPDVLMGLYSTEEMLDVEIEKSETQQIQDAIKLDQQALIAEVKEKNPEDYELGSPTYMVQNAKYRGKRFNEIDPEELADYLDTLEKRDFKKEWESELITSIRLYLIALENPVNAEQM